MTDVRNTGHGWVIQRLDGFRDRCGGPDRGCLICKRELECSETLYRLSVENGDPTGEEIALPAARR